MIIEYVWKKGIFTDPLLQLRVWRKVVWAGACRRRLFHWSTPSLHRRRRKGPDRRSCRLVCKVRDRCCLWWWRKKILRACYRLLGVPHNIYKGITGSALCQTDFLIFSGSGSTGISTDFLYNSICWINQWLLSKKPYRGGGIVAYDNASCLRKLQSMRMALRKTSWRTLERRGLCSGV